MLRNLEIKVLKNEWKVRQGSVKSSECSVCTEIGMEMEEVTRKQDISLEMQALLEYVHNFHLWFFCSCSEVCENPSIRCCGHKSGLEKKEGKEEKSVEEMCKYHEYARAMMDQRKKQGTFAVYKTWLYQNFAVDKVGREIWNLPRLNISDELKHRLACITLQHVPHTNLGLQFGRYFDPFHSCEFCKNKRYRWNKMISSSRVDDFCQSWTFLKQSIFE